jgi:hypothetical protein
VSPIKEELGLRMFENSIPRKENNRMVQKNIIVASYFIFFM